MRVAIIGCGNLAKIHINKLRKQFSSVDIALVDINTQRLELMAEEFSIVSKYTSIEELLEQFNPQSAHITTPPDSHFFLAKQLLANQVNCFIEKPVSIIASEAKELIELAAQHDCNLVVNHMRVADPLVAKAQALIKRKGLGKVVSVSGRYSFDFFSDRDYDSTSRWLKQLPGGPLFDLAPHVFSALEVFAGKLEYHSHRARLDEQKVIDLKMLLRGENDITVDAYLNLNTLPLRNEILIECEFGQVEIDFRNFLVIVHGHSKLPNAVARITGNLGHAWQIFYGTCAAVVNFIRGRLDPYAGMDVLFNDFYQNKQSKIAAQAENYIDILEQTGEFKRKKQSTIEYDQSDVLITGANGYLGRALVAKVLEQGKTVRLMVRSKKALTQYQNNKQIQLVIGDIYDKAFVDSAVAGVQRVYHLAAAMRGNWQYHLDTTIQGTDNIIESCNNHGVSELVYMSTLNVYDALSYQNNVSISEDFDYESQPKKRGHYSHAKLIAEQHVIEFAQHSDTLVSILRPGLIHGPGLNPVLNDLGIKLPKGFMLGIGLGNRTLPLVYIDHLVNAAVQPINATTGQPLICHLVDDDNPDQKQYISELDKQGIKIRLIPMPLFVYQIGFKCLDFAISKILKRELNLSYRLGCLKASPHFNIEQAKQKMNFSSTLPLSQAIETSVVWQKAVDEKAVN